MSSKLIILGMLNEKEMHPYEIKHTMKERKMEEYINIREGSLYYSIEQLLKDGAIEVSDVINESNRPNRTVYKITNIGRKMFSDLLLQQFSVKTMIEHPMFSALQFASYGDPEQISQLIEIKITEAKLRAAKMRKVYEEHFKNIPKSGLYLIIGSYEYAQTEVKWLQMILEDSRENKLGEIGVPLGVKFD